MLVAIIRWIAGLSDSVVPVLYDLSQKFGDPEMLRQLKKCLRRDPCWVDRVAQSILEFVGTLVIVPAITTKFVAKDKFVVNVGHNASVKIAHLSDKFKEWFLSGDGKVEKLLGVQTLHYHRLRKPSADGPIITELGGRVKAETTLCEMFSLMEKQGKGEDGVLLSNGNINIFYIKDDAGTLRMVGVVWCNNGWGVGALTIMEGDTTNVLPTNCVESVDIGCPVDELFAEYFGWWKTRNQVFSRHRILESSEI